MMHSFNSKQQKTRGRLEFDEEYNISNHSFSKNSGITNFVINNSGNLIKDKTQAIYFLIALTILCIILTIFFTSRALSDPTTPERGEPQLPTIESAGRFNEPPGI